jgi:NitT/TauT family transport system ATP-binding protein
MSEAAATRHNRRTGGDAPAGEAPLLHIDRVTKRFGNDVVAVSDVSLDIKPGEFLSLLGPSGCGKTTLLGMVGGLFSPSAGRIEWPQARHGADGKPERSIGVVFQEPTLLPWRTVFDNVYLPLKLAGIGRAAARDQVMEGLAQVGLAAFAGSYPRQLSGGMKMRASIARALIRKPKILLMDEPFAALDEITRTNLSHELLGLFARQDLTVIFVTHSVYESVFLSSRIVVMSARPGRIIADLAIDAPYPRTDEYRTSVTYNEHCRRVSGALKEALAGVQDEAVS